MRAYRICLSLQKVLLSRRHASLPPQNILRDARLRAFWGPSFRAVHLLNIQKVFLGLSLFPIRWNELVPSSSFPHLMCLKSTTHINFIYLRTQIQQTFVCISLYRRPPELSLDFSVFQCHFFFLTFNPLKQKLFLPLLVRVFWGWIWRREGMLWLERIYLNSSLRRLNELNLSLLIEFLILWGLILQRHLLIDWRKLILMLRRIIQKLDFIIHTWLNSVRINHVFNLLLFFLIIINFRDRDFPVSFGEFLNFILKLFKLYSHLINIFNALELKLRLKFELLWFMFLFLVLFWLLCLF